MTHTPSRLTLLLSASALLLTHAGKLAAQPEAVPAPPAPPDVEQELREARAAPGGLTSDAVAVRAMATSFDVKARRAELLRAAADVDRALAAYLPRLDVSARYARLSRVRQSSFNLVAAPSEDAGPLPPDAQLINAPLAFPMLVNQYALQASLSVPVSDYFLSTPHAVSAARSSERAARFAVESSRRRAATEARLAYYGWVEAKLQVTIAEQALSQNTAHLADVRAGELAGTATPADVLGVEARVAASAVLVEQSVRLTRVAEERLRVLMHRPDERDFAIGEDLRVDPTPLGREANVEALFARGRAHRPELRGLAPWAAALRSRAGVESARYLPRLDAFGNAQYSNPNPRVFPQRDEFRGTWEVGGVLSWTPSDIPGAAASVRGVKADVLAVEAELDALEDSVRLEITAALEEAREADASVPPTDTRLEAATEAYRVRRELFRNGRATSVELSDAETELTSARIEALGSRVRQRVARVRLAHAVGRPLLA